MVNFQSILTPKSNSVNSGNNSSEKLFISSAIQDPAQNVTTAIVNMVLAEEQVYDNSHVSAYMRPSYGDIGNTSLSSSSNLTNDTCVNYVSPLQGWETSCFCPGHLSVCLSVTKSCPLCNSKTVGNIFMKLYTNVKQHETMCRAQEP